MNYHSKNPVLNGLEKRVEASNESYVTGKTTTFTGIATKTGFLLAIIFAISLYIWYDITTLGILTPYLPGLLIGGMIVGFISVLVASFSRTASPTFTVIYAIAEGVVLGTISSLVEKMVPGIVFNAIVITFAIFGFLLVAYSTGLFKVGMRFRKIFYTMMFGLMIGFLFYFIFGLFGINLMGDNPTIYLIFTLVLVLLASFSLLIDFDNCKMSVEDGLPARYEWYLSLGILVSLIWLYIEILRLLLILSSMFRD